MAEQNSNENGNKSNENNKKKQKGVNKSTSGSKIGGETSKKKKQLLRNQRPDGDWPETEEKEEVLRKKMNCKVNPWQTQSMEKIFFTSQILKEMRFFAEIALDLGQTSTTYLAAELAWVSLA